MRVVFNALSSYRQRTGIGSYAAHLAAELKQLAGAQVSVFPEGWMAPLATLAGRLMGGTSARPITGAASHLLPKSLGSFRGAVKTAIKDMGEWTFRRACRRGRFELYHEPNFIPWECDLPTVVTVHDLSVVRHPEWHPRDRVVHHQAHFAAALGRAERVLTGSECTRREVIELMGLPGERVRAIPYGVRSDMRPLPPAHSAEARTRLGLPSEYLLYVGTIEPRKNVLTLLRAYCSLESSLRSRCPLVLAGPWGWNYARERAYLEDQARHRGAVHLGYVADADLPALYNGATALVYPSHYEGFGLPPVEMMACGGAVLASTAEALREVCGEQPFFIDPADETGWRDAMRRVVLERDWRAGLCRGAVERARPFSWRRTAAATFAVYGEVAGKRAAACAA